MASILAARKKVVEFYDQHLDFSNIQKLKIRENTDWNYSYYPVLFKNEGELLKCQKILNKNNIFPRRYFYPSLNTIKYSFGDEMKTSEDISQRVLCLPIFFNITKTELSKIARLILNNTKTLPF